MRVNPPAAGLRMWGFLTYQLLHQKPKKVKLTRINGSKEQKVCNMPLGDNYAITTPIFLIEYDAKRQVEHIFISPCICIYAEHWFTVIWYQDIFNEHCILQMLNNFSTFWNLVPHTNKIFHNELHFWIKLYFHLSNFCRLCFG